MYRQFTKSEAEDILRSSEGRPTLHRGQREGHAGQQHLLLSNAELLARYDRTARNNKINMITAFSSMPDMVNAAFEMLNAPISQLALPRMFGAAGHQGMRLDIHYNGNTAFRARYAQGSEVVRTFPATALVLVVDRVDVRPFRLHVQSFFPTFVTGPDHVGLKTANGAEV